MQLPYAVAENFPPTTWQRWKKQFVKPGRAYLEGLWRRTQDPQNKELSGWRSAHDYRRKIVHFMDEYTLTLKSSGKFQFELKSPYLWIQLLFPKGEISLFEKQVAKAIQKGKWKKVFSKENHEQYQNGDLRLTLKKYTHHFEDVKEKRTVPSGYEYLEFTLFSTKTKISRKQRHHPWEVLKTGIRKKDVRGKPRRIKDLKELIPFLPVQVELGCGPSIEAGIPPLHYLHGIYFITDPFTKKFILTPKKDFLMKNVLENPEKFYKKSSHMYVRALKAKITPFYHLLHTLHQQKKVVGPIITNNFDGLPSEMGLTEKYVRKYEESHITPDIHFHPSARALLVVGSHADRRRIQHAARRKGLKVIYVDPEGYAEKGRFIPSLLESAQNEDFLIPMTANQFAKEWKKVFLEKNKK